jgi:hypothetical protein
VLLQCLLLLLLLLRMALRQLLLGFVRLSTCLLLMVECAVLIHGHAKLWVLLLIHRQTLLLLLRLRLLLLLLLV